MKTEQKPLFALRETVLAMQNRAILAVGDIMADDVEPGLTHGDIYHDPYRDRHVNE